MKKLLVVLGVALATGLSFADEWLWIGPYNPSATSSDAVYANSANWSNMVTGVTKKGYPNSATDIAVFDGDARLRCANNAGEQKFGGMKILSGTVTFLSYFNVNRAIQFAADTNEIYIAEGATLNLSAGPSITGVESGKQVVIVTGPGDLTWSGNSSIGGYSTYGCLLKDLIFKDFHGGSFSLNTSMSANSVVTLRVADGMTVSMSGVDNKVGDSAVLRVDKGGTIDFGGRVDTIGGFEGDGTMKLGSSVNVQISNGPYVFGGRCTGTLKIQGTASSENRHFLLTSTNAFAETTILPAAVSGHRLLQFAPGVGEFVLGSYTPAAGQDILLEDTDGNPVTVKMALGSTSTKTVSGSGNFTYTGTEATYQANALDHTGWINVAKGTVKLGNSTEASDAPLEQYAGFGLLSSSASLQFLNAAKVTIDQPIEGDGLLVAAGPADFPAFRRQVGSIYVSSDVTMDAPAAKQSSVDVQGNGHLTLNGGTIEGLGSGRDAHVNLMGTSEGARISVTNGAMLKAKSLTVRTVEVVDSTLHLTCNALGECGTTEKPQTLTFDNATVIIGDGASDSADTFLGLYDSTVTHRRAYVKEGGVTFDINADRMPYGCAIRQLESGTETGVLDGGITVKGLGWLRFDGSPTVTGPIRLLGAESKIGVANLTTVGDLVLGTAGLTQNSATLATGADSTVSLIGAMTIQPAESGLYTFGPAGAAKDGVFTREQGGVLFVRATKGDPTSVKINGGVSDNAAGVSKIPVITVTDNRADGTSAGRWNLQFARFGEDGVLENVYGTAWSDALTASDIGLVDDTTAEKQVTANQTVGGLRVFGSKKTGIALSIAKDVVLTVGSGTDPACVLLNNSHANGKQAVIGGAGTLDFGPREGIIVANLLQSASYPVEINCKIAGTGGVTFAGAQAHVGIKVGGANTYEGGTVIESAVVQAADGSCFGKDTVTIPMTKAYGGEVVFTKVATFANDFRIGGFGSYVADSRYIQGAFWFSASTTLTGSVELLGETNIGGEMNVRGTLDGAVTGAGPLTVQGAATLAFGAANTFTCGLTIASSATVEVKEGATLGADAVTVNGVLRFANETDVVVPNAISGAGTIELAGRGIVTFADKSGFTGKIVLVSGGALDLAGEDRELDSLDGASTITNSGAAATLTLGGANLSLFTGAVAGPVSLVKRGDRTQAVAGELAYEGATTVEEGTLRLGDYETFETLPVTDDQVRLDAAVGVTLVDGDDEKVASWADADGKGMTFSNVQPSGATLAWATVAEAACGPALRFGAQDWVRLSGDAKVTCRTFFGVFLFASGAHLGGVFAEMFGSNGADSGVRIGNNNGTFADPQTDYINGTPGHQAAVGKVQLFTREYGTNMSYPTAAVGGYSGNKRPWYGDIHEIVVYGRVLNDTEREAVNDYLMVKWGLRTAKKTTEKLVDVLPTTTDLTVGEAGAFDLGGCDQTLASLVCLGSLTNDSPRRATLTLTGDSSVDANASFGAPNLDLVLGPGVTLDLGGGTFTIRRLINDDGGQVVNGTLNELKPRGGTLLIIR